MQLMSDWNEFNLCREMGVTPDELAQMDAPTVQKWLIFMAAEREAEKKIHDREMREAKRGRR